MGKAKLELRREECCGAVVVECSGLLSIESTRRLRSLCAESMAEQPTPKVVLDFRRAVPVFEIDDLVAESLAAPDSGVPVGLLVSPAWEPSARAYCLAMISQRRRRYIFTELSTVLEWLGECPHSSLVQVPVFEVLAGR